MTERKESAQKIKTYVRFMFNHARLPGVDDDEVMFVANKRIKNCEKEIDDAEEQIGRLQTVIENANTAIERHKLIRREFREKSVSQEPDEDVGDDFAAVPLPSAPPPPPPSASGDKISIRVKKSKLPIAANVEVTDAESRSNGRIGDSVDGSMPLGDDYPNIV